MNGARIRGEVVTNERVSTHSQWRQVALVVTVSLLVVAGSILWILATDYGFAG